MRRLMMGLFVPVTLTALPVAILAQVSEHPLARSPEQAVEALRRLSEARQLTSPSGRALLGREFSANSAASFGVLAPPDRVVRVERQRAVARLPAQPRGHPDLYLYLEEENGRWTITALRSLALTGPLHELIRLFPQMPNPTPEQQRMLRNARLTVSSDADLIEWFGRNRAVLERARANPSHPETRTALQEIGGLSASQDRGRVRITIGGLVDNEVGFLFVPDDDPPAIDPSNYIWIERVAENWFLYKTT